MEKNKIIIPGDYYISKKEIIKNINKDASALKLFKKYKLNKANIASILYLINESPLSENSKEAFRFAKLEPKMSSVLKSFDRTVEYIQDIALPFIESNAVPYKNDEKPKVTAELKETINSLTRAKNYIKQFLEDIPHSETLKAHKKEFDISSDHTIHLERIRRLLYPFALYCYKKGLKRPFTIASVFITCIDCVLPRSSTGIIGIRYAQLLIENNKVIGYVKDYITAEKEYAYLPDAERDVMLALIPIKYNVGTLIKTAAPPRKKIS